MKIFHSNILSISLMLVASCNDKPEIIPESNQIIVYPNPATDLFTISVHNPNSNPYVLQVFDTHGKIILDKHEGLAVQDYSVPISGMPKGYYHVVYSTGSSTITKKVVKL